jgi:GAF domain
LTRLIGDHDSGVWIRDLMESREFLRRRPKAINRDREEEVLERLRRCIFDNQEVVLDELVQIAVDYCGADSSGISLEESGPDGELRFRWVAVAGSFRKYLNGTTPRHYSPCGTCLDREAPQHYRVTDPYYNFLGVTAEPIEDGLLIPWRSEKFQGTIWLVSHTSAEAFDRNDLEFMQALANFVSQGMRSQTLAERILRVA